MRLQTYLAQTGLAARRKCERLIADGRVTVNGRVARLGTTVLPGDTVRVDGRTVAQPEGRVYIALNKPSGYSSDRSDPRNPTMFELVGVSQRLFGVGRLDKDSSGLILLTNDGVFAYRLTHPSFEHEKEYRVVVAGRPDERTLRRWRAGVMLEGEPTRTAPCAVTIASQASTTARRRGGQDVTTLRVVMHEGRKRQIRRVARLLGHPVVSLERIRIGSLALGALQSGEWRRLSDREVQALMAAPERVPKRVPERD
jgi:23S rRNA pseudouridine2605 synthase